MVLDGGHVYMNVCILFYLNYKYNIKTFTLLCIYKGITWKLENVIWVVRKIFHDGTHRNRNAKI